MKKRTFIVLLLISSVLGACRTTNKQSKLDSLQQLTFEELDKKVDNKDSFVAYFGWTTNCGDSIQFQTGYLEDKISTIDSFKDIYVVDLDKELPSALMNKEERIPMSDKYDVSSSPTVVAYKDGKLFKKIEWTALNSSDKTGILESELDTFFKEVGLLK